MKQTLFKKSKSGKIQEWTIEVDGDRFRTTEGFVDGQQTPTEWTVCKPKNEGRANATTPQEQAIKEAEAKVTKQKEKGWTEDADNVDQAAKKISPMLAHKYEDYGEEVIAQDHASQPKLDGIRQVAARIGLFTRNGKPIVSVPHIWEEVKAIFDANPDIDFKIDGEIYNHELKADFNKIASIVRKQKVTEEDLAESLKYAQYHVYDIEIISTAYDVNEPWTFEDRFLTLVEMIKGCKFIQAVDTVFFSKNIKSDLNLDSLYGQYLEDGYEGQMVRLSKSLYENSRSKNLLKRKEFLDEEFTITDIQEGIGNRSGMMGRMCFRMPNGNTFDSNARGTHDYFKELLANKEKYIGKKATVRYQNLTPDGVPRFPVMLNIRDYE